MYSDSYPIQIYYACADTMRRVEEYLKSSSSGLPIKDQNNLRFYVAMHAIASLTGKPHPNSDDLAKLDLSQLNDQAIQNSLTLVKQEYDKLGGTDQVAKGPSLLQDVLGILEATNPLKH